MDEWLLLGTGTTEQDENNSLLKVHHEATTTDVSQAQIETEVTGIKNGASSQVAACEEWLKTNNNPTAQVKYKGNDVVLAVSDIEYTGDPSLLLHMQTKDSRGDAHIEMLKKYLIDGTGYHVYEYHVIDKASYKIVTLNEKYGQR